MKLLAIAILVLGAAAIAHAEAGDTLIATDHDGTLVVSRVTDAAVETAYEEPNSGVLEYAFSDPHTLWVLRAKHGTFSIGTIVDGKPGTERVLSRDDWEPTTVLDRKSPRVAPHMMVTKTGEVWLQRCVDLIESNPSYEQCPRVYLRVDAKAPIQRQLQPSGLVANPGDWHRLVKQLDTSPKGWTFKINTRGFRCTGPKARLDFAAGTRTVANIEWIWSEPAIVRFQIYKEIDDEMPRPNFEVLLGDDPPPRSKRPVVIQDDGTGQFFLEDCKTYLNEVVVVAPDVVATTEGKREWKIRRGRTVIGTLTSARLVAFTDRRRAPDR